MNGSCTRTCIPRIKKSVQSTGWRATFVYPGGGTYKGAWLRSQHQRFGEKTDKEDLLYNGQWEQGKRHGYGTMRRRMPEGYQQRIYIGEWRDDMKHGEGKQYYKDGVYEGNWRYNRRSGLGIRWYNDGSFYVGEWEANVKHGLGIHVYANGNRYEGHFARGFKNGEGTFYHMHTGQIQKGMWENDSCKASMVIDDFRNQVTKPTPYPIPQLGLENPDEFVKELFMKYKENANKPPRSFAELTCLRFVQKMKRYARLETSGFSKTNVPFPEINFQCTCPKAEKTVLLQELD